MPPKHGIMLKVEVCADEGPSLAHHHACQKSANNVIDDNCVSTKNRASILAAQLLYVLKYA